MTTLLRPSRATTQAAGPILTAAPVVVVEEAFAPPVGELDCSPGATVVKPVTVLGPVGVLVSRRMEEVTCGASEPVVAVVLEKPEVKPVGAEAPPVPEGMRLEMVRLVTLDMVVFGGVVASEV